MNPYRLFKEAEELVDQGRLIPTVKTLEEARKLTTDPGRRLFATYNLGAIHYHRLGDGEAARQELLAAIKDFEAQGHGQGQNAQVVYANALENAMLLALSFSEFESLATRLEAANPGIPILTGLVPVVKEARERGESWSHLLLNFACRCYNRNDPKLDAGRYGQAKSTYHLLLGRRRELRLAREDWRLAVLEYCALSMRMAADCMKERGGDNDRHSPEEFLPILTDALPLVDEYLLHHSGDNDLKKYRGDMEEMVTIYRQRWASLNQERSDMPRKTDYQVCQSCGTVYARRDIDGPHFMGMGLFDHSTMCPKCGGDVVWQSSPNVGPGPGFRLITMLLLFGVILLGLWLYRYFFG